MDRALRRAMLDFPATPALVIERGALDPPSILLVPIGAVLLLATAIYISLTLPRR